MKGKYNKHLSLFIMGILLIAQIFMFASYADESSPTVVVTPSGCTCTGYVFNRDFPLYPGCPPMKNILYIKNEFGKSITVEKIGMTVSLSKKNIDLPADHKDAIDFFNYIKIKVEYKNFFTNLFEGAIYDGAMADFIKGADCSIKVKDQKTMELRYTISMDEEATDNIEGITADIDFSVDLKEVADYTALKGYEKELKSEIVQLKGELADKEAYLASLDEELVELEKQYNKLLEENKRISDRLNSLYKDKGYQ